jgi:DNA-binding MarR family transcriptional regulator
MRRLDRQSVDALGSLSRKLLGFRKGDGSNLPVYAEAILVLLRLEPEGILPMGELRKQLGLLQPRTSRICHALAAEGMVNIAPASHDRRSAAVSLTEKGARRVDALTA